VTLLVSGEGLSRREGDFSCPKSPISPSSFIPLSASTFSRWFNLISHVCTHTLYT